MRLQYSFNDESTARSFLDTMARATSDGSAHMAAHQTHDGQPALSAAGATSCDGLSCGIPFWFYEQLALQKGGQPVFTSTRRKEINEYGYQPVILPSDRYYLHARDETARMITKRPAEMRWVGPPKTRNPQIDAFLRSMWRKGFMPAAMQGDISQGLDGGSFVLAITNNGVTSQALPSRGRILGFRRIKGTDLAKQEPVVIAEDPSDPLIAENHLISHINVAFTDPHGKPDPSKDATIHGSRLLHFMEDMEARGRDWRGATSIDHSFDSLWSLRDVVFSRVKSQRSGNPVVVDVETGEGGISAGPPPGSFDADKGNPAYDDIATDIKEYEQNPMNTSFGVVENAKIRRMGPMTLDDVNDTLRILSAKLSHGSVYTANHFFPPSRGSEQVSDADRLDVISDLRITSRIFVLPIVDNLIMMGKALGMLPRKADYDPERIKWPSLRELNERERAFVDKSDATTMKTAWSVGKKTQQDIDEKFPDDDDDVKFNPRGSARIGDIHPDLLAGEQEEEEEEGDTDDDDKDESFEEFTEEIDDLERELNPPGDDDEDEDED